MKRLRPCEFCGRPTKGATCREHAHVLRESPVRRVKCATAPRSAR